MPWMWLVVAGLLEVVWSVGLKASDGFTRPGISALTLTALVGSFWLLSAASRTLPIGTAYPVWVGIGALGAAIAGWWLFGEPMGGRRVMWLCLLLVAIAGLKMEGGEPPEVAVAQD